LNLDPAPIDAVFGRETACDGQKDRILREQKGVVAAPSQLRTIRVRALPRSNQIEATLFD
jgi:hypothetical protein